MIVRRAMRHHAALVVLAAVLASCAPAAVLPSSPTAASTAGAAVPTALGPVQLLIHVHAHGPVEGARLKLLDAQGQVVGAPDVRTDARGWAVLPVMANVPAIFRIEAEGGRVAGAPVDTLVTDAVRHGRLLQSVRLNGATTLAAYYADAHPGAGVLGSHQAVRKYLGLPSHVDLGHDLSNPLQKAVDHRALYEAARSHGGFAALAADVDTLRHQKAPRYQVKDEEGTLAATGARWVLKKIAGGLLQGAANKVGGSAMGWVMGNILGSDQDGNTDLSGLKDSLAAQKQQLDQLSNAVSQLTDAVHEIHDQITALEKQQNRDFGVLAYDTAVASTAAKLADIDSLMADEEALAAVENPSTIAQSTIRDHQQQIRDKVPAALTLINNVQLGRNTQTSALDLYYRVVMAGEPSYPITVGLDTLWKLTDQLDYFSGMQLKGLALLVDAYHADLNEASNALASSSTSNVLASIQAQEAAVAWTPYLDFPRAVAPYFRLSPAHGLLWWTNELPSWMPPYLDKGVDLGRVLPALRLPDDLANQRHYRNQILQIRVVTTSTGDNTAYFGDDHWPTVAQAWALHDPTQGSFLTQGQLAKQGIKTQLSTTLIMTRSQQGGKAVGLYKLFDDYAANPTLASFFASLTGPPFTTTLQDGTQYNQLFFIERPTIAKAVADYKRQFNKPDDWDWHTEPAGAADMTIDPLL